MICFRFKMFGRLIPSLTTWNGSSTSTASGSSSTAAVLSLFIRPLRQPRYYFPLGITFCKPGSENTLGPSGKHV